MSRVWTAAVSVLGPFAWGWFVVLCNLAIVTALMHMPALMPDSGLLFMLPVVLATWAGLTEGVAAGGSSLLAYGFVLAQSGPVHPLSLLIFTVAVSGAIGVGFAVRRDSNQGCGRALELPSGVGAAADFPSVVHDLRSPLTAIRGYAHLIGRSSSADHEGVRSFARRIEDETRRMDLALGEALEAAVLRRAAPLRRERLDLVALVREVVEAHQYATKRRIDVATRLCRAECDGDEAQLRRALQNVVDNAVKYSPEGSQVAVEVHGEMAQGRERARVTVVDHGIGIPDGDIGKVFQTGHRAANALQYAPGSGLGLASVREIVERHGGTVVLNSQAGEGTVVTLSLPLAHGATEDRPAPASTSLPVLADTHLLQSAAAASSGRP